MKTNDGEREREREASGKDLAFLAPSYPVPMCRAPPLLPFFSFPFPFKFPFPSRTHDFLFLFFPRLIIYSTQNLLETTKPNPTQHTRTHLSLALPPSLACSPFEVIHHFWTSWFSTFNGVWSSSNFQRCTLNSGLFFAC